MVSPRWRQHPSGVFFAPAGNGLSKDLRRRFHPGTGRFRLASHTRCAALSQPDFEGDGAMTGSRKPAWVIDKERARRNEARETVWLFGLHAVRDALSNPRREKLRLVVTRNAADKLADAIAAAGIEPEICDPRKFAAPLDEGSVHQGAALEVRALNWGKIADVAIAGEGAPLVVLLDRVTDPHNVGAVLRRDRGAGQDRLWCAGAPALSAGG
jgi:hypothetical protein